MKGFYSLHFTAQILARFQLVNYELYFNYVDKLNNVKSGQPYCCIHTQYEVNVQLICQYIKALINILGMMSSE